MAKAKIDDATGLAAVRAAREATDAGAPADRTTTATAVRYLLQLLETRSPGKSVEVRVPPFGAAQCIEGPGHTRGTPPNVIETDAASWLALATGGLSWADGVSSGRVHASGSRADLTGHVPLV